MKHSVSVLAVGALIVVSGTALLRAQDAQAEKTLIANERAVNEAVVKGNVATFKKYVSADAWSIDPMGGRSSVADFVKNFDAMTKDMKITTWDITDTRTVWVDPNTAVLTYKWTGSGTYQGQPLPSPMWCSTVWTKKNGQWTAVYHQETLPMTAPAPAKQ